MKRLFVLLVSLILICTAVYAAEVPKLQGYVNDYGNMMSAETRAQITEQLKALEQSDSTQIFVLTVPSLEGDPIEDFAIKVFDVWKAGQKNKDNGVLLIVAQKERKIRIEVGRGLEGKLTDLASGRIIDNVIKPKFKEGDFNGGFIAGVSSLVQATRGEFKADGGGQKSPNHLPLFIILGICAVIVFVLGRRSPLYGIATGAIGGPVSLVSIGMMDPVVLAFAAVFGGFAATFIAAISAGIAGKGKGGATSGGGRDFDSSSDSGWSSGSSDSDTSGGGGESGGGGASGDY